MFSPAHLKKKKTMKLDPTLKRIGGKLRERTVDVVNDPLPPDVADALTRLREQAPVGLMPMEICGPPHK